MTIVPTPVTFEITLNSSFEGFFVILKTLIVSIRNVLNLDITADTMKI